MESFCGADCKKCGYGKNKKCKGCKQSDGCPFGEKCMVAKYIQIGGMENFNKFKQQLVEEFNRLNVPGMPEIKDLNPLNGAYVNLAYPMPNGYEMKILDDNSIYLGN